MPSNPDQVCSGNLKRSNAGHPIYEPTRAKKTFMLHGPRHSSEECKFLRYYTEKLSAQHTYKDKQALSGGNKRGKTVKFEGATEEVNIMKSNDEPIPRKKKVKRQNKKPRLTKPMQTHQRMDAVMNSTILI